jgi:FMN phosphatase YigB (HAD superfamily)
MPSTVALFDVDNTLLDNDAVAADLRNHLAQEFGEQPAQEYWRLFEALRSDLGYADYLGALQQFRLEHPTDPQVLDISAFLIDYPFANRLYPGALDAIAQVGRTALPVILSDGDAVFQPRKIERSGIWRAVGGRVLVYIHKEQMLDDVARRFPADRYVMVDDKRRLLTAIKNVWRSRVTTVFVRQGHYAHDPEVLAAFPPADETIDHIADVVDLPLFALRKAPGQ